MTNYESLLGPTRDAVARGEVAVHDHVCGIYDTHEDQYQPACRFLKAGLDRNEQCLYILERSTPTEFSAMLEAHGVNVDEATKSGALEVATGEAVRHRLGGFTPDAMFSFLVKSEKSAREDGFAAFRWAADMTWLRADEIDPADMFLFEAKLTDFLLEHELVALCQYAMVDFRSELLIAAAETHPLLVYNEVVCDNFYYIPPEEHLKPQFSDRKLKRMLYNIVTRERLMHRFLTD